MVRSRDIPHGNGNSPALSFLSTWDNRGCNLILIIPLFSGSGSLSKSEGRCLFEDYDDVRDTFSNIME